MVKSYAFLLDRKLGKPEHKILCELRLSKNLAKQILPNLTLYFMCIMYNNVV